MPGILAIDDDGANRRLLVALFKAERIEVTTAPDGPSGLVACAERQPAVVLLDLGLPGMDGFAVLEQLRQTAPLTPVIMLTASNEVKDAVRAIQLGAFDYLTKPMDHDEVVLSVRRALDTRALRAEVEQLRKQVGGGGSLALQMGPSPQVQRIVDQVATVAATELSVLVAGETGTGKELVAQALHRQSERRDRPLIALDCGAIPEALLESELFGHEKGAFTGADRRQPGKFHLAEGGTVFLDEIGNLPLALQAKLLRVLESRQVQPVGAAQPTTLDVRFLAATNDDLEERVAAGRFRADLYFRLAQYTIVLPPLRDRRTDIAYLANRFLDETRVELRRPVQAIAPEALAALERHDWPGNVRELRNVVRQLVLESAGSTVTRPLVQRHVKSAKASPPPAGRSLREVADDAARVAERELIVDTLRATRGNKAKAARLLQTDYKTLHVKLARLGIRARDFAL
jgi:DNA-binding NtrC family response regulator